MFVASLSTDSSFKLVPMKIVMMMYNSCLETT